MIAAIDGRAGLPTDQPQVLTASPRGQRFSRELDHARQESPAASADRSPTAGAPAAPHDSPDRVVARRTRRDAPSQPKTPKDAAHPASGTVSRDDGADASAAQESGAAPGSSAEEPEQKGTRRGTDPSQTAIPDAASVRAIAPPPLLTADQTVGTQPRDEQVLGAPQGTLSLAQAYAASGQVGGTLQAQLGRAAYRLSPHAANEPVQTIPQGRAPDAAAKSLQPADPEQQAGLVELHVVSVQEMIQLSNEARVAQGTEPDLGPRTPGAPGEYPRQAAHADPNSAQARNQLLAQIGGPAHGVQRQAPPTNAGLEQRSGGAPGTMARDLMPSRDLKPASAVEADAASETPTPVLPPGAATVGSAHQADNALPVHDAERKADPALLDKIVQESRWLIRSGHSEVTLKLQPEHLGDMKLKVVHKDGNMSVQMTVDSSATKHLLEASMSDLRQRLQAENLAQGNLLLNVDVRQGADSGGFNGFAGRAAQEGGVPASTPARTEEAAGTSRVQPRAWSDSNISIYA